jgi:hypothetical protein
MLQIEQQPIDRKIGQEILRALPPEWKSALLTAERHAKDGGSETYRITLGSQKGEPGVALVSDELQGAIRALFLLHAKHETELKLARYIVEHGPKGWNLVSEFEYES